MLDDAGGRPADVWVALWRLPGVAAGSGGDCVRAAYEMWKRSVQGTKDRYLAVGVAFVFLVAEGGGGGLPPAALATFPAVAARPAPWQGKPQR